MSQEHRIEVLACDCCDYVVRAERPYDNDQYGAGFLAHLVVSKCVDALPLHRIEKMLDRQGIPMSRSTRSDLFHRLANLLAPLYLQLLRLVSDAEVVRADETSVKDRSESDRGHEGPVKDLCGALWA